MKQKRIMAINDISCFGKCSLTVALPVLSAAGFEICPVPTALLSTHTGGFENVYFQDLSEHIEKITNHWKSMNLEFDTLYSGYLGSKEQVYTVKNIIKEFAKEKTKVIVDPVMGDSGRLYSGFNRDFVKEMSNLCADAHVITPNITEAAYLTGTEYKEMPHSREYIETLIGNLSNMYHCKIVLTGVCPDNKKMGAAVYDGENDIEYVFAEKIDGMYHGTGDVFASSFIAKYMKTDNLIKAAHFAVNFVTDCIKETKALDGDIHYGVNFEKCLSKITGEI